MKKMIILNVFLFSILLANFVILNAKNIDQCKKQIYEGCFNTYVPNDEEVERARIYIQDKFMKESNFPPTIPPCPKLYVRRNFKCMTHEERLRVINVVQKLYANGFMWEMAEIHAKCYAPWHKSMEGAIGHRWFTTKLELEMRKIDPDISIPYWISSEDCANPHESLIWRYFGTAGTQESVWCVNNCPFEEQTKQRCIKRQWNPDGSIKPWYCPLLTRMGINLAKGLPNLLTFTTGQHFHYHLNIGGANGHFSHNWASYDFVFYMLHVYYTDLLMAKWQLQDPKHLTSLTYNHLWRFNVTTHKTVPANISSDTLCHFNTPVIDTWQFGFGEQCWISDEVIEAINLEIRNESRPAVEKFKASLPSVIRRILSPIMNKWNGIQIHGLDSPDPSLCNPDCSPQPPVPSYTSDETSRQLMKVFRDEWNLDLRIPVLFADFFLRRVIDIFNRSGYCSPYVPSKRIKD